MPLVVSKHSCPRESLSFSPPALLGVEIAVHAAEPDHHQVFPLPRIWEVRMMDVRMYRTSDLLYYTFGHAPQGLEDAAVAAHLLPIAVAKVAVPGPISALEALSWSTFSV